MATGKLSKSRFIIGGLSLPLVIAASFIFFADDALAYDDKTTHPALTEAVVDFYNASAPADAKISNEEKEWIIEGSSLEDAPPRWINHFYDPVHKTGWTGEHAGSISPGEMLSLSGLALSSEKPLSAVEWATNYSIQESYSPYGGNRSWKRGIEYLMEGNEKEAYITLGHILHLLEDMGVPDHTRGDTHADAVAGITGDEGSPYEQYASRWNRDAVKKSGIVEAASKSNTPVPDKTSVADYLVMMAEYSNRYFFSKDTINDPKFDNPRIVKKENSFGYGHDESGDIFPLVRIKSVTKTTGEVIAEYYLDDSRESDIFDSYFSHLSRQIILNGAGTVKLFKKNIEDAKLAQEFPSRLVVLDPAVGRALTMPSFSLIGVLSKAADSAQSAIASAEAAAGKFSAAILAPFRKTAPAAVLPEPDAGKGNAENRKLAAVDSEAAPLPATIPVVEEIAIEEPAESLPAADAEAADGPSLSDLQAALNDAAAEIAGMKLALSFNPAVESAVSAEGNPQPGETTTRQQNQATLLFYGGGGNGPGGGGGGGVAVAQNGGVSPDRQSQSSDVGSGSNASEAAPDDSSAAARNSSSTESVSAAASSTAETAATSTEELNVTSTLSIAEATTTSAAAFPPVYISEVQVSGADAGDEFIELYNASSSPADISGWSLQYVPGAGEISSSTVAKKNFSEGASVPARGFYLAARGLDAAGGDGYRGSVPADISERSFSLSGADAGGRIFLVASRELITNASDTAIADSLDYGGRVPARGGSIERKAISNGECVSPQGDYEYEGNGCAAGGAEDRFELRPESRPQNSRSMAEPRSAPGIPSFAASYNVEPRFDISWSAADAEGATSTLSYSLAAAGASGSSTAIVSGSSSTAASYHLDEVGAEYVFSLAATDRDGLAAHATTTALAPSFFDKFSVYPDTRNGASGYVADIAASSSRPFWDPARGSGGTQSWKAVVFYKNKEAPKQALLTTDNNLLVDDAAAVSFRYPSCGGGDNLSKTLLFPWDSYSCGPGPLSSGAMRINNLEDLRFTVGVDSSSLLAVGDYLTAAFYDFAGGGGGSQRLSLAAVDRAHYAVQSTSSPQEAPAAPPSLSLSWDRLHPSVHLSYSSSTDADTLDRLLTYETAIATSSDPSAFLWQSSGSSLSADLPAPFGGGYFAAVRAKDDWGNASTPAVREWTSFSSAAPSQGARGAVVGGAAGSQGIAVEADVSVDGAALWAGPGGGPYSSSEFYVLIQADSGGAPGETLATSSPVVIGQYQEPHEVVLEFPSPVALRAGSSYWITAVKGPRETANDTAIYGSFSNPYGGGYWRRAAQPDDLSRDAYFFLRRAE